MNNTFQIKLILIGISFVVLAFMILDYCEPMICNLLFTKISDFICSSFSESI